MSESLFLSPELPAYTPQECFQRISRRLRATLKRGRIPMVSWGPGAAGQGSLHSPDLVQGTAKFPRSSCGRCSSAPVTPQWWLVADRQMVAPGRWVFLAQFRFFWQLQGFFFFFLWLFPSLCAMSGR